MRVLFDIETDGLLNSLTKLHCLVIKDMDTGQVYSCSDSPSHAGTRLAEGLKILSEADLLVGHNVICYDLPAIRLLYPTFTTKGLVRDTLVLSRLIWADIDPQDFKLIKTTTWFPGRCRGSHSLEAWGYRLRVLKGEFGKTADWSEWSKQMQEYCEQDVQVTEKLWETIQAKNYAEEAITLEHEFREVIFLQEQAGFPFDREAALALHQELLTRRDILTKELQDVLPPTEEETKTPAYWVGKMSDGTSAQFPTKGAAQKAGAKGIVRGPNRIKFTPFNPGSRQQIAVRLKEKGWVPCDFTPGGAATVDEEILKALPYPEAKMLAEYLMIDKRMGQLANGDNAWLKLEKNGRIHGEVITNGTVTGRCAHLRPNMGQVPAVEHDKKTKAPKTGAEGGYGFECRSLFTADKGMVLVGTDASGLELRCLGHYMAKYDGGDYAREVVEGDVHQRHADIYQMGRNDGKPVTYAYLYGAGNEKLGRASGGVTPELIETYKRDNPKEWKGAENFCKWRKRRHGTSYNTETIGLIVKGQLLRDRLETGLTALASLKTAIDKSVDDNGFLRGLDGRRLHVRSKHSDLNTLLQACGSVVVKYATVLFYKAMLRAGYVWGRDFYICAHVHDEWQTQCRPEIAPFVGQTAVTAFRETGEHFGFRCKLDGEFKVGRTWAETH